MMWKTLKQLIREQDNGVPDSVKFVNDNDSVVVYSDDDTIARKSIVFMLIA